MSTPAKQKSRLGRGLSALLSSSELPIEAEVPAAATPPVAADSSKATASNELPLDQIKPNPHQPRRQFSEASLSELAASLKSNGLIQPIIVRKSDDGYQLVAGERRLR